MVTAGVAEAASAAAAMAEARAAREEAAAGRPLRSTRRTSSRGHRDGRK